MKNMKAVQVNGYGGVEVLEIRDNVSKPSLSKNQVLVEVYAASINPYDWKVRAGYFKDMIPINFPLTLGGDFSGVVVEVGEEVKDIKVGDSVYGQGESGSFAEFVAASVAKTARKPKNIDHLEAASLPLVGVSAIQALEDYMKLGPQKHILIHGGAGGIGSIAIQLAKHLGAYVATTIGGDDKEYAKELGADEVIDYKHEAFEEKLKDFDAVFDLVGGQTTEKSFHVLKKGGVLVSMVGQPNPELAKRYGVSAIGQMTEGNKKRLTRLTELVESGAIKPQIDKVFPLTQTKEAFMYLERGHPRGKVVLKIKE